jgi:sugar/nucleoside kinase (ribokinase family)
MSGYDVLVAGEYYCDLIFAGLDAPPRLGDEVVAESLTVRPGGCYNMALGLTRLGIRTAWACDFGTDLFSRLVLDHAKADGIDPVAFRHLGRDTPMVSAAFTDARERGFVTYRGHALAAPATAVLATTTPRWLLQSFRHEPEWLAFMRAAKAAGAKIFGDCSGDGATLASPGVRAFIELCDVFSPNETEALVLTGAANVEAALTQLAALCPTILVKRGSDGVAALADGRRYDEPAPAVRVVDTVGAGDAFAAGFLAASLRDLPFAERLAMAVACGALSTTGAGSSASPTAAELEAFTARSRPRLSTAASA